MSTLLSLSFLPLPIYKVVQRDLAGFGVCSDVYKRQFVYRPLLKTAVLIKEIGKSLPFGLMITENLTQYGRRFSLYRAEADYAQSTPYHGRDRTGIS